MSKYFCLNCDKTVKAVMRRNQFMTLAATCPDCGEVCDPVNDDDWDDDDWDEDTDNRETDDPDYWDEDEEW